MCLYKWAFAPNSTTPTNLYVLQQLGHIHLTSVWGIWYDISIMGRDQFLTMPDSVEKYGVKYIKPYHKELARMIVLGASQAELCAEFHVRPDALSIITRSPLFQLELERLGQLRDNGVADVGKTLKEISPIAVDVLERTMYRTKSERLKVDIAKDILDRAGHGAINKQVVDVRARADSGYADLTSEERKRLVEQRIQRMMLETQEKEEELKKAEAVDVTFEAVEYNDQGDNGNGCSPSERAFGGFADCD